MCLQYKVTTIFWMYLGEDWWAIIWTRPHQKLVDILCIHEFPHTDDYNFWFSSSSSKRWRGPICLSLWVSNPNLSCYGYLTVQNKRHSKRSPFFYYVFYTSVFPGFVYFRLIQTLDSTPYIIHSVFYTSWTMSFLLVAKIVWFYTTNCFSSCFLH